MSSQPTSSPSNSRKGSLTRAFSKLKRSMTKRTSRIQQTPTPEATVEPTTELSDQPAALPPTSSFGPEILEIDEQPEQPATESPKVDITVPIHRQQSIQTRLSMLGDEFGVNVQHLGLDILPDGPRPGRVQKKIRMRVHYNCHNCEVRFGASKVCIKCNHQKCRECHRDPPKKIKEWSHQAEAFPASSSRNIDSQSYPTPSTIPVLETLIQRSSQAPGMPVERVQYACHECASSFMIGTAHFCPNCGHQRCNKCARQLAPTVQPPDDLAKILTLEPHMPDQAQRRRVWKKPRQRVRWSCHQCQTTFQQGGRICSGCKHTRCDSCTRVPPRSRNSNDPQLATEAVA